MSYDVFISYSSKNITQVNEICDFLENNGVKCFLSTRDIPKGIDWATIIPEAIRDSKLFLVIHSEEYNLSIEVDREIKIASDNKKQILTLRIDECEFRRAKEYYLTVINWIDLSKEKAYDEILKTVMESLGKPLIATLEKKKSIDYSFLWFVIPFFILFSAGFIHAHVRTSQIEDLKSIAVQNIQQGKNPNILIYSFPDDIVVYDRVSFKIETFANNQKSKELLSGNIQPIDLESKIGYIGIGVLLTKVFNVKVKGRNAAFYYIGATVAIVCGYGLGYYIHEKFYPVETSRRMKEFLSQKNNWSGISAAFGRYERIFKDK